MLGKLDKIWYIIASNQKTFYTQEVEDPVFKINLLRTESPTIFQVIEKFKKNGYYMEKVFEIQSMDPKSLTLEYKQFLGLQKRRIMLYLNNEASMLLWYEVSSPKNQHVLHLLADIPHPPLSEIILFKNFLLNSLKTITPSNYILKPCTQRSEKTDEKTLFNFFSHTEVGNL